MFCNSPTPYQQPREGVDCDHLHLVNEETESPETMDGLFKVTCLVDLPVLEPILETVVPHCLSEGNRDERVGNRVCGRLLSR